MKLQGYVNCDLASDSNSQKSNIGFGVQVVWFCSVYHVLGLNLQNIVALSNTKAKYIALS